MFKNYLLIIMIALTATGCSDKDPYEIMNNASNKFKVGWHKLDDSISGNPKPRYFHAMAKLSEGKALMFGGGNQLVDVELYDDTWLFEERDDNYYWKDVSNSNVLLPEKRWKHKMVNIGDGKVILFGGVNIEDQCLNDVWLYDLNNGWKELSGIENRPDQRCLFGFSRISEGKALLLGGYNTKKYERYDDSWIYNFLLNEWTELFIDFNKYDIDNNLISDCLHYGISDFNLSYLSDNVAFFYSGFTWINSNETEQTYYKDAWIFNNYEMKWNNIPITTDHPGPRQLYSSSYLGDGKTLLFAGVRVEIVGDVKSETYLSDSWIFNYHTKQWMRALFNDDTPCERFAHDTADFKKYSLVLFGGVDANRNTLNDTWIFTIP